MEICFSELSEGRKPFLSQEPSSLVKNSNHIFPTIQVWNSGTQIALRPSVKGPIGLTEKNTAQRTGWF